MPNHLFSECPVFFAVWMDCLGSLCITTTLQRECRCHFIQFQGLAWRAGINRQGWQVVWFSMTWSIWLACNNMIFKSIKKERGEIVESAKLLSWQWLKCKQKGFMYPISSWFTNPVDFFIIFQLVVECMSSD